MLSLIKASSHIINAISAPKRTLGQWWLMMSDAERRRVSWRGISVAACAVSVMTIMPMIGQAHDAQREEAEDRLRANLFAELGDGAAAIRAVPDSPSLIQHPWLVRLENSFERDSQAALGRYASYDRDGAALTALADFDPRELTRAEDVTREHTCLSEAVYYEARSESASGQLAVAEVILNRVADHRYPNSICEVVYQGATRTTGCQFTFTCDGSMALRPRGSRWDKAQSVAAQVLMDLHEPRTADATHYHATYVDPIWNSGLVRTEKIGLHIFYRFPQGREWTEARARLAARRAAIASARIQSVSADAPAVENEPQVIETVVPAVGATAAP